MRPFGIRGAKGEWLNQGSLPVTCPFFPVLMCSLYSPVLPRKNRALRDATVEPHSAQFPGMAILIPRHTKIKARSQLTALSSSTTCMTNRSSTSPRAPTTMPPRKRSISPWKEFDEKSLEEKMKYRMQRPLNVSIPKRNSYSRKDG